MASLQSYKDRKSKTRLVDMIDSIPSKPDYPRPYLGLSGLGNCIRSLWFGFRFVQKGSINVRTQRIFSYGHYAETIMIEALESIGIELWNTLEDQDEFIDCYGYAKGHPDCYGKNIPGAEKTIHLIEFKTMNDKSFKDTVKKGVKESKPTYYAQMVLYMYEKELTRALFMAVNKNNSEFYTERLKSDNGFAKELIEKGNTIVFCEDYNELPRIGNNKQSWYECKWCSYNKICFGEEKVKEINCRTCVNCDLINNGKFACSLDKSQENGYELSTKEQKEGCNKHEFMECFK